MIEAFAKTIDMKDKYTKGHSNRVAEYTAMLAKELGCDEETVDNYYNIALLHEYTWSYYLQRYLCVLQIFQFFSCL